MNKQERKLKGLAKFKKRKAFYPGWTSQSHNILKSTGKPCSCTMCSPGKIGPKSHLKIRTSQELKDARVAAYEYLL